MRLNAPPWLRARVRAAGMGPRAVTAEDSERLGFVTLAQFLRQLPALAVLHDGGNGGRAPALGGAQRAGRSDPLPAGRRVPAHGGPAVPGRRRQRQRAWTPMCGGWSRPASAPSALAWSPTSRPCRTAVVRACRQHNLTWWRSRGTSLSPRWAWSSPGSWSRTTPGSSASWPTPTGSSCGRSCPHGPNTNSSRRWCSACRSGPCWSGRTGGCGPAAPAAPRTGRRAAPCRASIPPLYSRC